MNDCEMKKQYGHFNQEIAGYTLEELNLPTTWDYIYKNDKILLKVDQHGPIMAQLDPPGGIVLFRREYMQRYSSWMVWATSKSLACRGLTNFFRPCPSIANPAAKPDKYNAKFSATEAIYTIEHENLRCETSFLIPPNQPTILMRVKYKNLRDKQIDLNIFPAFRSYVNPAQMAPWDKPEWYLKTSLFKCDRVGFLTQLLNMNAQPDKRRYVVSGFSDENIVGAETYYEKFVGQGNFDNPESVFKGSLRLSPADIKDWGVAEGNNFAVCFPAVNAVKYDVSLKPDEEWEFSQVLSLIENGPNGTLPEKEKLQLPFSYLESTAYCNAKTELDKKAQNFINIRSAATGQDDFDNYLNRWLPILLDWVCSLDRGWPSGMRGSRDSSNDFTAMVPIRPELSRQILLKLCECQRSDGWFPRQYSDSGRKGKHDLRGHVDAGCWAIELMYTYVCYTKDLSILDEKLPWLDEDKDDTVLEHMIRAMNYFIAPKNLGEHGICKIGEGDWNDSVNMAGLRGRGESVMVSCQTVIALEQMLEILSYLKKKNAAKLDFSVLSEKFEEAKTSIAENLRKYALNEQGYFNSVFNDDGKWLFSPNDPDGQRRVGGPANWYAISSGVAQGETIQSILKELEYLKCEQGYRLFCPPFGKKSLQNVGRLATGDQPEGVFENGTAYNQGSHGFLARALAVAGLGDKLYEVICYLLPYDQRIHPTESTMTAPFAVTNCWLRVPGFMGRGGLTFLTGSIAMGLRAVYDWMFGIKPNLDGLIIDPCLPSGFKDVQANFKYLNKQFTLKIKNNNGQSNTIKFAKLNDVEIQDRRQDPFSKRNAVFIKDDAISKEVNQILIEFK